MQLARQRGCIEVEILPSISGFRGLLGAKAPRIAPREAAKNAKESPR